MSKEKFIKCYSCGHGTDIKPGEPFIKIEVSGGNGEHPSFFSINGKGSVELLACPSCGTVKIDLYNK